jgi:hypothetical protein
MKSSKQYYLKSFTDDVSRARAIVRLVFNVKNICKQKSYYPEEPHKSTWQIFCDQLYFIWKYGWTEKYYYLYGFDRKGMDRKKICDEYIIFQPAFYNKIFRKNNYTNHEKRLFPANCIVTDKFYFYLFLKSLNFPTPKILYYTKNGKLFYDEFTHGDEISTILNHDMDAFAKQFDGQLGNGVFAIKIQDSKVYVNNELVSSTDELLKTFTTADYIIQERIKQHPELNKLCSTAVNTIRLVTLITPDEEIIAVRAGLRIGREGSCVDNCAKGGVFVGIDLNTGKLMKRGIIKPPQGMVVYQHPDNGVVFEGFEIPFFKEAVEMAKELHSRLYRIHSVGWDIAITSEGPTFIEGNSLWEISGTQAAVGGLKHIEKYFD